MATDGFVNQGMLKSEVNINEENVNGNICIAMHNIKEVENAVSLVMNSNVYDPYLHRHVKHPTSFFDTWIHLLKASLGTGILAMPSAFKNAGYIIGSIGTMLIGFLCTHCIHLLTTASYRLCVKRKVPSLTYADTAAAAFEECPGFVRKMSVFARILTNVFLVLYQLGSSSVYVVFIAKNLKAIGDIYVDNTVDERMYMVYLLLPLIAITWIKNLKLLSPFSSIATCLTTASLAMIFYYIFREPLSFTDRTAIGTVQGIPQFFGTVLFAMEAIGMILPLENEMKKPKKFSTPLGVLNTAMIIISFLYNFVGLLGYLKYGDATTGSITLDLPQTELLAQLVKIFLSLSIYINYALSNYVAFSIIWNDMEALMEKFKYKVYVEFALRTTLVMVTFFVAILVPNLEHLISLIGAFCLSTVGIALPVIIHFMVFFDDAKSQGPVKLTTFVLHHMFLVVIAVFAFTIGVSTSLAEIINHNP